MKKTQLLFQLGMGFSIFCYVIAIQAANLIPLWEFTPDNQFPPQRTISPTAQITVLYTVKNNSTKSRTLVIMPQAGVSQNGPCIVGPRGTVNSTCTLSLTISGNEIPGGGISGGPALCQVGKNGAPNLNQCYQPNKADSLLINLPSIRKNAKYLSYKEKKTLVDAILALKSTPSDPNDPDSMSIYDMHVMMHLESHKCMYMWNQSNIVHNGPQFLTWHRGMLMKFESDLRRVSGNPNITLPYWDWTDNESFEATFAPDLMGGDGVESQNYAVVDGPFAKGNFTLNVVYTQHGQLQENYLQRRMGLNTTDGETEEIPYPTEEQVTAVIQIPNYDTADYDANSNNSFRNALEGFQGTVEVYCDENGYDYYSFGDADFTITTPITLHNLIHYWVSGSWTTSAGSYAGSIRPHTSPNDPVFWLHHANVDRIYEEWIETHPNVSYPIQTGDGNNAPEGYNGSDPMFPGGPVGATANQMNQPSLNLGYIYDELP